MRVSRDFPGYDLEKGDIGKVIGTKSINGGGAWALQLEILRTGAWEWIREAWTDRCAPVEEQNWEHWRELA